MKVKFDRLFNVLTVASNYFLIDLFPNLNKSSNRQFNSSYFDIQFYRLGSRGFGRIYLFNKYFFASTYYKEELKR